MGKRIKKLCIYIFIALSVLLAIWPLAVTFGKSFAFPEGYKELLLDNPLYLRLIWNSVCLLVPVLLGQYLIAPLAAYGFWQWRWKYKEAVFFVYMIVMLMPMQLTLVPRSEEHTSELQSR